MLCLTSYFSNISKTQLKNAGTLARESPGTAVFGQPRSIFF